MLSKYVYGLSLGHFVVDFSQGALAALLPLLIAQHHFNYAIAATLVFAMNLVSSIIQPLFYSTAVWLFIRPFPHRLDNYPGPFNHRPGLRNARLG
ncbi:hypothetical protein [Limosilactobacillus fermentum]|uniref:hypothetical protein n=1 Tax=Limosilactobacillus fermentum TaxID=1613 RepID=UPI002165D3D4|nr:hypothetical protein [Limosilactobacillus fermentum]UVW04335.1 hypothetical protein NX839_04655 [Limosilactobacillus fermentum]WEN04953.1 hypothetical protein P0M30_07400 [Limosilactobacillus fermentum]WEN11806.1 hypothetical protein P0N62_07410 [Limosilactobacillus fermentum]WJD38462.1 hypothetical protein QRA02_07410 [Limosilactobacillus fermentum]